MHDHEKWRLEFTAPLAATIRAHALKPKATPLDRLAAAALLLAMEINETGKLLTTPVIVKSPPIDGESPHE